jgi:hypothetical protein
MRSSEAAHEPRAVSARTRLARRLAKLGRSWRVLHSIPVAEQGTDIDHMVIGPGGVFTVKATHHPRATVWVGGDTFLVNGAHVPYIRNSRLLAKRVGDLLSAATGFPVSATGVIAVTGVSAAGLVIRQQPADRQVLVVAPGQLHSRLATHPEVLSTERIHAIYEAARRSATWHGAKPDSGRQSAG